nr:hypothetical protein [Synechococcus sp. BIOS-E4-1]
MDLNRWGQRQRLICFNALDGWHSLQSIRFVVVQIDRESIHRFKNLFDGTGRSCLLNCGLGSLSN